MENAILGLRVSTILGSINYSPQAENLYELEECCVGKSKIVRQIEELGEIVSVITSFDASLNLGNT